jgi:hypothetical protein
MNVNLKLSDEVTIVAAVDPVSGASGSAKSSGYVDVRLHQRLLAAILTGAVGAAHASVAAKLQQATSSAGAGLKDITGKAIVAFDGAASPSQSSKQALINLRPNECDLDNGFFFVKLVITSTDLTSPKSAVALLAGLILSANDEYQPQTPAASVLQVV